MDKLRAIELFIRLADLGSFTAVANEKNLSKSMISKEVSRLEHELGARLLHRSTRDLRLTQAGEGYLQRCRTIQAQMEEAEAFVQDLQEHPKGKLKINAPMALGLTTLPEAFSRFMQTYPDIELEIELSDEPVDLVQQGFDLGFRAASTRFDSSYIGKALTQFSYHLCASAQYIQSSPPINRPKDLAEHNCFVYSYFRGKNIWPLGKGIAVKGTLKVNSTIFMMEAIKADLGIGLIPDFVCSQALADGDVIEVLPNTKKPKLTLYALYPARQYTPPKLRCCIEFMENWFNNLNP